MRSNLTYHRTIFHEGESYSIANTPNSFQEVVQFLIDNGGFIENNSNGFTPGHFCYKFPDDHMFLSSQRKADHNKVFLEGMSRVTADENGILTAEGRRKPSVGATSQWMILNHYPAYDCIVHTHNPLKEGSSIPIAEQLPFQCGSLECGTNTLYNLKDFDGIKAVYLNKHGANIVFKSSENSRKIVEFIKNNLVLHEKTT